MNILHLIETTGPGGAETVLINIIHHLPRDRFASAAVATGPGWVYDNLTALDIPVEIIPLRQMNGLAFLGHLRKIIRKYHIDLLHAHLDDMNFYATLGGWLCGKPVVTTFHGLIGNWTEQKLKTRLKLAVVRHRACRIIAVSDFMRETLIDRWKMPPPRVHRIYNGVDFSVFETEDVHRGIREEYGIPTDAPLVAAVGNIREPKGYEYLVRAAKIVREKIPESRFLIIGQGEGALLDQLNALITELDLTETVIVTGFREDIPQLLSQIDLFALTSLTEGLSIATIEAMAAGKAVVVTASGGPEEIVDDGVTGFLVPPADDQSLAERITQVLSDHQLRQTISEAGRQSVRQKFSIGHNVNEYIKVYRQCVTGESGGQNIR